MRVRPSDKGISHSPSKGDTPAAAEKPMRMFAPQPRTEEQSLDIAKLWKKNMARELRNINREIELKITRWRRRDLEYSKNIIEFMLGIV